MTWGGYENSRHALRKQIDRLERQLAEAKHNLAMAKIAVSQYDMDAELAALLDSEENR